MFLFVPLRSTYVFVFGIDREIAVVIIVVIVGVVVIVVVVKQVVKRKKKNIFVFFFAFEIFSDETQWIDCFIYFVCWLKAESLAVCLRGKTTHSLALSSSGRSSSYPCAIDHVWHSTYAAKQFHDTICVFYSLKKINAQHFYACYMSHRSKQMRQAIRCTYTRTQHIS